MDDFTRWLIELLLNFIKPFLLVWFIRKLDKKPKKKPSKHKRNREH